jgi:hypothetical protein
MNKLMLLGAALMMLLTTTANAQTEPADSTGLPGDHFSLEAALELFKQAGSPEEFEKLLNSESSNINNLDLNEDGEIDYIRVIDNMQGDAHAIILQAIVSESESQDIAVIEIEKQGEENAILQIIGNEDVYGEQVISEPFEEEKVKNGKDKGPWPQMAPVRVVVNVWFWPSVRFMYRPGYVVYVSPFRWRAYPTWWRPWRPYPWRRYHAIARPYRARYHVVHTHRVVRAHAVYTPHRRTSKTVHTRTTTVVAKRGKHGGTTVAKKTTTTTRGRNGNVQQKTTTKAVKKSPNGNVKGAKRTTTTRTRGGRG